VIDAGLDIYPLKGLGGVTGGFCRLDELRIGELSIVRSPCTYTLTHYEKRAFGRAPLKEKKILFGLRLMKKFRYILIDNINQEVEFSLEKSFEPTDPNRWSRFTASIESHNATGDRLIVEVPIVGKTRHLCFDTGTSSGLVITKEVWKTVASDIKILRRTRNKINMMHGFEPCDEVTVETLVVGDMTLSHEKVQALHDGSRWGNDLFLMGMGFFQEVVVVLDFECNLLWLRKSQSLKIENSRI
jgi:hypothetical protein